MSWYTVFSRTNVSADVSQLTIERTVSSNFTAMYCSPDCTAPTLLVELDHAVYEHAIGFLNVTRDGIVYEDDVAVPAIAVLNTSAAADGWMQSRSTVHVTTPQGVRNVTESFAASGQAGARLAFSPALGLFPTVLAVTDTWNSSSTYTGSGGWSVAWNYTKTSASGTVTTAAGTPSGVLALNGSVELDGAVVGNRTLPSGAVAPAISLDLTGDITALDGVILLPRGLALFDTTSTPWDGYRMGFTHMETHQVAVQFTGDYTSFRLVAANAFYGTNDSAVQRGESMRGAMGSGGMGPFDTPAASSVGVPTTDVSAVPVTVAEASDQIGCLADGSCTTVSTVALPVPLLASGLAAATAVVAATIAGAAVTLYGRRRPTP